MQTDNKTSTPASSDQLFASQKAPIPFRFNEQVAAVFDDMIVRSVPLYKDAMEALSFWAQKSYQPGAAIYDLGCSTGTTIEFLCRTLPPPAKFIGVDNSPAMIERAQLKLAPYTDHQCQFLCQDLMDLTIELASIVIMNYTLQFLPVEERLKIVKRIYQGLNTGGVFFLSDKICGSCLEVESTSTEIYENFKHSNGYSRTEIERKKEALDQVLIPLSLEQELVLLKEAGFCKVQTIMQWHNFVSIVAIKS